MPAGFKMSVQHLIEIMLEAVGQRGSEDLKYHWFETYYSIIREQPWPWNWKTEAHNTHAHIVSTETYTWAIGDSFVQGSGPLSISHSATGRKVEIDSIIYLVSEVDTVANRVYFNAPMHTTESTGATLTFYRADVSYRTSSIFNIDVDGCKVISTSPDYWKTARGARYLAWGGARPTEYILREEDRIEEPLYAPAANGASSAGNIGAGTYEYFFTKYDPESKAESAPGPVFVKSYTVASQQSILYSNPSSTNVVEGDTYTLRLYRSKVSPAGERYPAWLVGTKSNPKNAAEYIVDNFGDGQLIAREKYWGGTSTIVEWAPWPDDVYPVRVRMMDDYGGRPDPSDKIDLGRNNIVDELLRLGVSGFVELSNRDVDNNHKAIAKFRAQLAYLMRRTAKANADDPGYENTSINTGNPEDYAGYDPVDTYGWKN